MVLQILSVVVTTVGALEAMYICRNAKVLLKAKRV